MITNKVNYFLYSKEAVQLKWTNMICTSHNESWIKLHECRLRAISRNVTTLNLNATVFYSINDVKVDAQLLKKANGYKPWLIKSFIDFCRFFKTSYSPYAKIAFFQIKEYTNINHSCPYVGPAIIKGFHINAVKIGLPFPTGEYLVSLKWFYHKKLTLTTRVYFTFTEDYIDM
ncbi:hypothetical protein KR093_006839 [Drosophila rubida]|uniref:Uncharacterized protein n=1 Tax=Drosophila rubida TaxID=30044 RepID=A0AAD4K0G6_9MUSC|nr:hypothetical protein KR093_006839 [Drosophila rubida]